MRSLLIVAFVLAASLVTGCGPTACPAAVYASGEALLEANRAQRREATALRAEARVDQRGREGRIRGTVMMFVEKPSRVRVDAMTQFGPAAILTSDGETFSLTDLRENRFLTGPTCPANIARLLGIPMADSDVAKFVFGESPVIPGDVGLSCTEGGAYLASIAGEGGLRQEIEFAIPSDDREKPASEQRPRITRSELFGAGGTLWRATFEDHTARPLPGGGEVIVPFKIRFEDPGNEADTLVRFQEMDLNPDVPAEAFVQTPAPGLSAEHIACDESAVMQMAEPESNPQAPDPGPTPQAADPGPTPQAADPAPQQAE